MVMLEHMNSDKMDSRYGLEDESDGLIAVDPLEVFLQNVYQNVGQSQKKWPSNGEPKRYKSLILCGAEGETRTRMSIQTLDPEPSASTSSATSARGKRLINLRM
jgi:hypothetical protein